jgi:hypothetical protein
MFLGADECISSRLYVIFGSKAPAHQISLRLLASSVLQETTEQQKLSQLSLFVWLVAGADLF